MGVIAVIIAGVFTWFKIPYSPIKSGFKGLINYEIANTKSENGVFTEEDISKLPSPVQKYFQYCGYLGKPKMSNMKAFFKDVDFILSPDKPKLKIDYTQYNFVDKPNRIAFIDTSLYGIPFEGLDTYKYGTGSMKGVIGKVITLFNQNGKSMDKSCLVTCLAECLLFPNLALQDFIQWEEIDKTQAKAAISYGGISASGIFTFNDKGEMTCFTTDDRENIDTKGRIQKVRWSAIFEDYKEADGIKHPTTLQGVWHYKTGDLVYFDGRGAAIEYDAAN